MKHISAIANIVNQVTKEPATTPAPQNTAQLAIPLVEKPQESVAEKMIRQSNIITNAHYEMGALEKNILYMVLAQLKRNATAHTIYKISIAELKRLCGNKYIKKEEFIDAIEKLVTRGLTAVEESGNVLKTSFIASAYYIDKQGIIEVELASKILPYYLDIKEKFTTFQIHTALNLSSKYSKRLYEFFSMYKNFPKPEFTITIQELKEKLCLVNDKKDQYPNYNNFKKNVIDKAVEEINNSPLSDIFITYKEIKSTSRVGKGRIGISAICFTIQQVARLKIEENSHEDERWINLVNRLISTYKLSKKQAHTVIRNYDYNEITKMLYEIDIKRVNREVSNVGAYTATCFNVAL